jgi:transposase
MGKSYSPEYKTEAMKLMMEIGKSETEKRLGVSSWTLSRWAKTGEEEKKQEKAEKGTRLAAENREMAERIKELEKENARIKKENEFLEEAASFFAASRQKSKQN